MVFVMELITFLLVFFLKDINKINKEEQIIQEKSFPINWSLILIPTIIMFLSSLSGSSLSAFLSLYAISLGLDGVGAYFSINAIGLLCSRFTMKKINDLLGTERIVVLCCILLFACTSGISVVTSLWQILVLAFPIGFATGDLGFMFGSTFWGIISTKFSYSHIFKIAALMYIIAFVLSLLHKKMQKQSL